MKTSRTSILSSVVFVIVLCSMSVFGRIAMACPVDYSGSTSFTCVAGGSQSQTWTVSGFGSTTNLSITTGSDVFFLDQTSLSIPASGATFTITFTPGANATGTFTGTLHCSECNKTFTLVGTVATAAGVANALPSNVSIIVTPNPATDNVSILSNGARTVEIGVYDLLGKELASTKATTWKWDASGIAAGSYIVRIVGESYSGEPFIISRRIFISR